VDRNSLIHNTLLLIRAPFVPDTLSAFVCRTVDKNGLAVWALRIGKEEIPGRWVIVDREFVQADER